MSLAEHLEKVPIFQKLLQAGSLRKAAKELHLSQPALTRTLAILERECDCALVVRTQDGLKLTPHGQHFLEYSRKIQKLTEEIGLVLKDSGEKYEASLQMGTYESIAVYFFPFFLGYLRDHQQKLRLNLKTMSSANLMEELKMSRLDMIVSVNPSAHRSVISKVLYTDTFGFYSKTTDKGAPKSSEQTIISVHKAAARDGRNISDFLKSFNLSSSEWIDCASFETVKALLLQGLGTGILPSRVAEPLLSQRLITKISLPKCPPGFGEHTIGFSYLKSRETDPAIKWIYGEMKSFLNA